MIVSHKPEWRGGGDMFFEALGRTKPRRLASFLLNGTDTVQQEDHSCADRVRAAENAIRTCLHKEHGSEESGREETVFAQIGVCEEAYFEMGMRAGAKMILELLQK